MDPTEMQTLKVENYETLRDECVWLSGISPNVSSSGQLISGNSNYPSSISGVGTGYLDIRQLEMEDGVNEHGLAVGLTSVYPCGRAAGFNAGLLLRYFLERCRNIQDVIACLKYLPISSAQTFTLADMTGNIAVIECNTERTEIISSLNQKIGFVCASNRFHHPAMQICNNEKIDDWFAERRYQTMLSALSSQAAVKDAEFSKKLLSGCYGFLCQYDRAAGKDTVWSVVYDLQQSTIYRSEGNPRRVKYREDKRFQYKTRPSAS